MSANTNYTEDPRSYSGYASRDECESHEANWIQIEVPKELLCGYGMLPASVEPSPKVIKWLDKNCTGEWRWFYRILGGYDKIIFLCFEKEEDLFYFRLRF